MSTANYSSAMNKQSCNKIIKPRTRKNLKQEQWVYIDRKLEKRIGDQKQSSVYVDGVQLDESKLKKELSRNVPLVAKYNTAMFSDIPSPENIQIYTPEAFLPDPRIHAQLPWHEFATFIQHKFDLSSLASTSNAGSLTTSKSLTLLYSDDSSIAPPDDMEAYLQCRLIEVENNSVVDNVRTMSQGDGHLVLLHMLRYVIYLISNNLWSDQACLQFLDWIVDQECESVALSALSVAGPTAGVVVESLSRSAILRGNSIFFKRLLQARPEVIWKSKALRLAIKSRDLKIVEMILLSGVALDELQWSLYAAVTSHWSIDMLATLVKHGAILSDETESRKGSILVNACLAGCFNVDVYSLLLRAGADVNALAVVNVSSVFSSGSRHYVCLSALQAAVLKTRDVAIIDVLVKHGAHINGPSHEDAARHMQLSGKQRYWTMWTPIALAASLGQVSVMQCLQLAGADINMARLAIAPAYSSSSLAATKDLFFPNGTAQYICTPQEAACALCQFRCIEELLNWNATLNADNFRRLHEIALLVKSRAGIDALKVRSIDHLIDVRAIEDLTEQFEKRWTLLLHLNSTAENSIPENSIPENSIHKFDGDYFAELDRKACLSPVLFCYRIALSMFWRWAIASQLCCEDKVAAFTCWLQRNVKIDHESMSENSYRMALKNLLNGEYFEVLTDVQDTTAWSTFGSSRLLQLNDISKCISDGADPNALCFYAGEYFTPLLVAVKGNDLRMMKLLVSNGAKLDYHKDRVHFQPLLVAACETGDTLKIEFLLDQGCSLFGASLPVNMRSNPRRRDHHRRLATVITRLVKVGLDVNTFFHYDNDALANNTDAVFAQTLLQFVTRYGTYDEVVFLVQQGAKIDDEAFDVRGVTALQAASVVGNIDVVNLLLKHKANVNAAAASEYGRTALQTAALHGRLNVVSRLLAANANVNACPATTGGVTALQAAAIGGYLPVAELLIESGAEVAAESAPMEGRTALQGAAEWGRLDMLQLLLNHYDGDDWRGDCIDAAEYAERNSHLVIASWLRDYAKK